jgi:hypothetical protein
MGVVNGVDLRPFNALAPNVYSIEANDLDLSLGSDAAELFSFDFTGGGPYVSSAAKAKVAVTQADTNGVAQWLRLDMGGEIYENRPGPEASSSWATLFYPYRPGLSVDLRVGGVATICGVHNRRSLRLWVEV